MAADKTSAKKKQHDLEESPRERAKRLLAGDMTKILDRSMTLRKRSLMHGRWLSEDDKASLISVLQAEFDEVKLILEGVSGPREFGFPSDLLDGWDD